MQRDDAMREAVETTASNWRRRARDRRRRRALGALCLAAPTLLIIAMDVARRGRLIAGFDRLHALGYVASAATSMGIWAILLHAASRRRGALRHAAALLFVALYGTAVGVQGAFHALFRFYLSADAEIAPASIPLAVSGALPLGRPVVIIHLLFAFAAAVGMVALARRFVRPGPISRRYGPLLIPPALYAAASIPVSYYRIQSTTPDLIYAHALRYGLNVLSGEAEGWPGMLVQRRTPEPIPPLSRAPARPRNVLLVLQEAQRADVTCIEYDPACDKATRASNLAAPRRLPLLKMRSNSSSTAISLSNLWSGTSPAAPREVILGAPLLWEFARAAGMHTAYWTSQHLSFGNSRLYVQDLPLDLFCSATHIDWQADLFAGAIDGDLSEYVIKEWDKLEEPFFAVVHYSNIHTPRVYDETRAPFQPAEETDNPSPHNEKYINLYKDVVYLSDLAVGRLIDHIRGTASGSRTVIVYTSDHGESYREHGQQGDHSATVFEEEIRVPAWIDAPEGTLSPEEEASIRAARNEPTYHLDLAPTILDLIGVWDDPALGRFRSRMPGRPLTRPGRANEPMPLTTASWAWEDQLPAWGLIQGSLKIQARTNADTRWHCYDLSTDPEERHDLGEEACAPLPALASEVYGGSPGSMPRRKELMASSPGLNSRTAR